MELHERLGGGRRDTTPARVEPFAELKNTVHLQVIGELGPQLFNLTLDHEETKAKVLAEIRQRLQAETGISRDDRERLTTEIADDILGYGPLERLLADDSITEIMVNGAGRDLDRAPGPALRDDCALHGRVAPAPDHQQDRRPGRPADRRGLADGRRAPARRQPRQRDHPAALALGPAAHDPEVLAEAPHPGRHGQHRHALRRRRSSSCRCASAPS